MHARHSESGSASVPHSSSTSSKNLACAGIGGVRRESVELARCGAEGARHLVRLAPDCGLRDLVHPARHAREAPQVRAHLGRHHLERVIWQARELSGARAAAERRAWPGRAEEVVAAGAERRRNVRRGRPLRGRRRSRLLEGDSEWTCGRTRCRPSHLQIECVRPLGLRLSVSSAAKRRPHTSQSSAQRFEETLFFLSRGRCGRAVDSIELIGERQPAPAAVCSLRRDAEDRARADRLRS